MVIKVHSWSALYDEKQKGYSYAFGCTWLNACEFYVSLARRFGGATYTFDCNEQIRVDPNWQEIYICTLLKGYTKYSAWLKLDKRENNETTKFYLFKIICFLFFYFNLITKLTVWKMEHYIYICYTHQSH